MKDIDLILDEDDYDSLELNWIRIPIDIFENKSSKPIILDTCLNVCMPDDYIAECVIEDVTDNYVFLHIN